ncbi:ptype ATPase [Histomonas meleagridis]|uniref:ptype ATPase n=1 Tax=Histomonas meleagridis TaxID=135588 RepID=UPI00355AA981|nr:ptype ATPase [Histomonas meleagridis]KAH0806044.1 ptype ATPase [Histomonas meleagridis]
MQLPKEYNSTIKPNLAPPTPESDYQHYFGTPGQHSISKYNFAPTIRNLSKSTRADIEGTTKITHHPPGYCGYIPREWHGNKGKTPRQDPSFGDIYWQHHDGKEGYSGYTPSCATNANVSTLKRASTTYRDMCDEIGFKLD